jgi:uncharacterized protein (TIGR02300 family)
MTVVKAEWGQKRMCQSCGARFYDMRRDPIVCPKCGTAFDPGAFSKPRRHREPAVAAPAPVAKAVIADEAVVEPVLDDELEEISDDSEEEEDETIEDASELGEDDDDMAEVMENLDEDEER